MKNAEPHVQPFRRVPLLLLGGAALVAGTWAGLYRLGAAPSGPAPATHGPLMVGAFLGTVIALERAVAVRVTWAYAGPLLGGLGGVLLMFGRAFSGSLALLGASVVVTAVLARQLAKTPWRSWKGDELYLVVMTVAAGAWVVGNALLAWGRQVYDAAPFWLVFLVGTIAAERLELTRVLPRRRWERTAFVLALLLLLAGAGLTLGDRQPGMRLLSLGALLLAGWLLRYDVARRTVKQTGGVRFTAAALLTGYVWLAVGGAWGLAVGNPLAGPHYDALLHAHFLGFVFSMIFGHAPIILPALLRVRVPHRSWFYVHLAALHLSVALRLGADIAGKVEYLPWAAWGNAAAVGLFLLATAASVLLERVHSPREVQG